MHQDKIKINENVDFNSIKGLSSLGAKSIIDERKIEKDRQNFKNKIIGKQLMQKKYQKLRDKLIGTKVRKKFWPKLMV